MRRCLKALLSGALAATTGVILLLLAIGANFEQNFGLYWLFNLRGPIHPSSETVVLAITEQTGEYLGLSKLPREWPRSVHAKLIENLTKQGVSAIIFDMDFQLPKLPEDDNAFIKATASSGRVLLVEKLVGKRQPLLNATGQQIGAVWIEQLLPPLPGLAEAAKAIAPFPLPKVQVAVHQFWAFKSSVNAATIPAAVLQVYLLDAYPRLQSLIAQTGVAAPPVPPKSARGQELQSFMQELRSVFLNNPDLGNKLRTLLSATETQGIPVPDQTAMQALIGLYEGDDNRYLNFYGPPGSITTLPYHLYAGAQNVIPSAEAPDLKGKVVFVGFSDLFDPGQPDRFYTVFSNEEGIDLSGVEIAATAFSNLLGGRTLHTPDALTDLLIVAGFGGMAGFFAYLLPAFASVPLLLLLGGAYVGIALRLFTENDLWMPLATPVGVQLPLALFIGLFAQYIMERRKKSFANKAISMYLPEHLAKDFTEKKFDENAFNRVTYCVCFASDMAGFTSIAEQFNPKELAKFLNDYFETLSAPLKRHGVDVLEFRADGVMCAWTADEPSPTVRKKALLAGLEAIEAIQGFKQRHHQYGHCLRIGIEAGLAYVGHSGGGGHYVYSIVGDCANTAARIEGLNKKMGAQLLASQSVLEGIDDLLIRPVGDFQFVGKSDALPIVEVMARMTDASEAQINLQLRFAKAMAVLSNGDIGQASALFAEIEKDFADDGPTRFYSAHCQALSEAGNIPVNPTLIRLDSK